MDVAKAEKLVQSQAELSEARDLLALRERQEQSRRDRESAAQALKRGIQEWREKIAAVEICLDTLGKLTERQRGSELTQVAYLLERVRDDSKKHLDRLYERERAQAEQDSKKS